MTDSERCRKVVEKIAEVTGEEWTFGYIGNCGPGSLDDRSWSAFRRTSKVGTWDDRIGGYKTDELDKLYLVLQGALKMARMLEG